MEGKLQQVEVEKIQRQPINNILGISDVLRYDVDIASLERTVIRQQIQDQIQKMDRKLIRCKSACLSSFSRPADHENMKNVQSELTALRTQLAEI